MKTYEAHDKEYERMEREGIDSWLERHETRSIDEQHERFFHEILAQSWCPKSGRVLEVGCGTAPILRWFVNRGFRGTGIDLSETALRMAKRQSKGMKIAYRQGDVCALDVDGFPKFHLCVDGACLHCLTDELDRTRLLRNVKSMLVDDGIIVILSMCSPVNRAELGRLYPEQLVRGHRIFYPVSDPEKYEGGVIIRGKPFVPARAVFHWRKILKDLRRAGFTPLLTKVIRCTGEDLTSSLFVCAEKS